MKINLTPLAPEKEYDTDLPYLGEDYDDVEDYDEDDEENCPGCPECDDDYEDDEDNEPAPMPYVTRRRAFNVSSTGSITVSASTSTWVSGSTYAEPSSNRED